MDKILEILFKMINEDTRTAPETIPGRPGIEPYEDPDAPEVEVPKRRRNPLKPDPGVHPEPKGITKEIANFLKVRGKKVSEAFNPGNFPSFVHPDKKKWITTGDEQLNKLFPDLSDSEQSYLEMISSKSYQEMLGRIEKYTGISSSEFSIPSLVGILQSSLTKVMLIESKNKKELEELAVSSVLDLDEFELVKDAYENGDVKFDVKLGKPDLNWDVDSVPEDEDELSQAEEMNVELAKEFEEIESESKLRRRMANLLIQGSAVLKTYLFNLVSPQLSKIDKSLPNLYGILGVLAQLGYWVTPDGIELAAKGEGEAGSEEVIPEGDDYIIKVRAIAFPYLVHELVKGIYEWISIDPDMKSVMKGEKISGETHDIMVGSEIFKVLSSYIPKGKQNLLPLVHKKYLQLSKDEMKSVLAVDPEGKKIMNNIINDAEEEKKEYEVG